MVAEERKAVMSWRTWSTRLGQFDPQKATSSILDNLPLIAATLLCAKKLNELDSGQAEPSESDYG